MKYLKLNNGESVPMIGFGTWQIPKNIATKTIESALKIGYRHIDGALIYENEKEVGNGIKNSGISRNQLYLVSKLWNSYHENPQLGLETTLKDLNTSYLDLYYIHWPVSFANNNCKTIVKDGDPVLKDFNLKKVYESMEIFKKEKKIKSIGIANFGVQNLRKLLEFCEIKPQMLQIELHPYCQQRELIDFCHKNDIGVTSYSSLGSTPNPGISVQDVKKDPVIVEIANKRNVSSANIILSWLISKNVVVIPKSISPSHIRENLKLIDLYDDEIQEIDNIKNQIRYVDPVNFGPYRFL